MQVATMKNYSCTKCQSMDIIRIPEECQPTSSPFASMRAIKLTRYCCSTCGYTEVFVDEPNDLKRLAQRFGF